MTIQFNSIPTTTRVPGAYTETNSNRAATGVPAIPKRLLVTGQKLAAGIAVAGVPFRVFSDADAESNGGVGSHLAEMLRVAKAANRFVELWGIALADAAGTAATGTATIAGTAAAGTLVFYVAPYIVGGVLRGRYSVKVSVGDTVTVIAAALVALVQADPYRQANAANTAGVVTFTARHSGVLGNSISLQHSYFDGEKLPGITCVIVAMASGATNPTLSTVIAGKGDRHYTHFVNPWNDTANVTALDIEMTRCWGGTVQKECQAFGGFGGTLSASVTFGTGRNSEFSCVLGTGASPSPYWIAAAELAAIDAGMDNLGSPLKGKPLTSLLPPKAGSEFQFDDRQSLLSSGIATYTVSSDGTCKVERLITTSQLDVNGNPSTVFLDRQVLGLLYGIRYDWRSYIAAKYPDYNHAADGTPYGPGLKIITPTTMRNEFEGRARRFWAYELGWIENIEQFVADIQIERTQDGMDLVGVPDLVNLLHVTRTRLDFLR